MVEPTLQDQMSKIILIRQTIEQDYEDLLRTIEIYVWKFRGIRNDENAKDIAQEILQNTIVTALEKAEKFDVQRLVLPWLKGIAMNHILTDRKKKRNEQRRSVPIMEYLHNQNNVEQLPENEMFDLLEQSAVQESPNAFNELLALVNYNDQEILRMKYEEGLDGKSLAERIGITEGAAKVRLHRAIARLEEAYREIQE